MNLCISLEDRRPTLFLAIGGGGDIALAIALALAYERCGGRSFIGSVIWERYVVDPVPGPISIDELVNTVERGPGYAIVNRYTFALRGGRVVIPQAVNASYVIGRDIAVFDIHRGAIGLANALKHFVDRYGVELVVGIDVGGDSLAEGFEEELWSPLADSIGVAALARLSSSYIAVASPGADGELSTEYVEKRIRRIASLGGYVGGYMLSRKDIDTLKTLLQRVVSEASSIPLLFLDTNLDNVSIRKGSRTVKLSLSQLSIVFLDAVIVARESLARYIYETKSLEEARMTLNMLTIVTEYDLEEEILRNLMAGGSYHEIDLVKIRNNVKKRILERHREIAKNLAQQDDKL